MDPDETTLTNRNTTDDQHPILNSVSRQLRFVSNQQCEKSRVKGNGERAFLRGVGRVAVGPFSEGGFESLFPSSDAKEGIIYLE